MAEFKEVIRHWARMGENRCTFCPLADECDDYYIKYNACEPFCRTLNDEADKVETVVMAWAAEHPEPVYPTWYDYLSNVMTEPPFPIDDHDYVRWLTEHRIHADIAQRLGLKPKEVEKDG